MRVCLVAPISFPTGGAASSRVRALALGLHQAGAEIEVFACAAPSSPISYAEHWREVPCTLAPPTLAPDPRASKGNLIKQSARRLLRGRADQQQVDYLCERLEQNLRNGAVEVVVLYLQQLPLALRILKLCRRYRARFVQQYAEIHLPADFKHGIFTMFYLRERFHLNVIPHYADGHLVISRWLERSVTERGGRHVLRVPALSNTEATFSSLADPADRKEILLTYLGAGARRDCLPEILEAMRLAHSVGANVKLQCIGLASDPLNQLNELAKSLGLWDHVRLLGYVDDAALHVMFGETNAFVLLRTRDRSAEACFPTRLPEFLATGRPVILTDVGDIGLYFRDRFNAFLVQPGDIAGVAAAMQELATNPTLRRAVGVAGRNSGAADFAFESHGNRVFEWLGQVVAESRIPA